jgi:secondary thiamine-phosphate synthase enzyme
MPQQSFIVRTHPRTFQDITQRVGAIVQASAVAAGLCNVFLRHTSASLLICENADPAVLRDLERFMLRLAPDGDSGSHPGERGAYEHDAEGPDDMPAHIRCVLTGVTLGIPVQAGRLQLGTWQGIYLWEHRATPHERQVVVTVLGA